MSIKCLPQSHKIQDCYHVKAAVVSRTDFNFCSCLWMIAGSCSHQNSFSISGQPWAGGGDKLIFAQMGL